MAKNKIIKIIFVLVIISLVILAFMIFMPKESNVQLPSDNRFPAQDYQGLNKHTFTNDIYNNNAKLIINNIDYSSQAYVKYNEVKDTFELPLLFISKHLGAEIYALDEKSYLVSFSDEDYILNTEINKMSVYNQGMNIIGDPKPITNPYANNTSHVEPSYKVLENDFIVENTVIEHFLYMRNADIKVKDNIVTIDTVQPTLYKLEINDKVITSVRVDESKAYAEIPFWLVVEELGGKVYKVSPGLYRIKINGNNLYFNSKDIVLSETKSGLNLFGSVSGGKLWTYYKISNGEMFIDSSSARAFLNSVGYKLDFNSQDKVIKIKRII